ncbi:endonuclease [Pseudoxanthomonas kalamensis DSM 18571]|uniref:S1/P1 nuclease n=1 Tax=Pseudoxanthomonas kalamensis TaxID=289483 RepID=UPI001391D27D|nr:S1/P1 nuclease [Pseudoxanthomonas kalamensis]KAF1711538.1 endonuclease [Pseudoxanthomonas kalamensis DSM 18571]
MIRPLLLSLFVLLLLPSPDARAWGRQGHRLVAELAEADLTPRARAEVDALLHDEPEPGLGAIASWADDLRGTDPGEFRRTSRWHYINARGGGCDFDLVRDCPDGNCVVMAIENQLKILADPSQAANARRDALKFVVHFVGDAHQPMHAGSRPDKGGNDFQISLRTDIEPEAYARNRYADGVMGTNLHSVWDYYILANARLSTPAYLERLTALPAPDAAADNVPLDWARESCRLIDADQLYPDSHRLDSRYLDAMRPLAERQLRLAGLRLARVLNDALDPAP